MVRTFGGLFLSMSVVVMNLNYLLSVLCISPEISVLYTNYLLIRAFFSFVFTSVADPVQFFPDPVSKVRIWVRIWILLMPILMLSPKKIMPISCLI